MSLSGRCSSSGVTAASDHPPAPITAFVPTTNADENEEGTTIALTTITQQKKAGGSHSTPSPRTAAVSGRSHSTAATATSHSHTASVVSPSSPSPAPSPDHARLDVGGDDATDGADAVTRGATEVMSTEVAAAFKKARRGIILGSSDEGEVMGTDSNHKYFLAMCISASTIVPTIIVPGHYTWIFFLSYFTIATFYFIVLPRHYRRIPYLGKTMTDVLDLQAEVEERIIPWWMPGMFPCILMLTGLLNVMVDIDWAINQPSLPREGSQALTAKTQADPNWVNADITHAARMIAEYVGSQGITLFAGGLFVIFVSTRVRLGKRARECVEDRHRFLCRYQTSIGTGDKIAEVLRDLESLAHERTLRALTPTKKGIIAFLSIVNAFIVYIFSPGIISRAYQVEPFFVWMNILASLFVGVPGTALVCYGLHRVTLFYTTCNEWLNQLKFTPFDLTSIADLLCWQEIRFYYLRYKMPIQYNRAEIGFVMMLVFTMIIYSAMVVMIFTGGAAVVQIPGIQMAWSIAIVMSVWLIFCLVEATRVWDAQQSHRELLEDMVLKVKFRLSMTATPRLAKWTQKNKLLNVSDTNYDVSGAVTTVNVGGSRLDGLGGSGGGDHREAVIASGKGISGGGGVPDLHRRSSTTSGGGHPSHDSLNDAYLERVIETLQQQIKLIEFYDPPPSILGISIKPTLLNVIAGYVVTAFVAVVGKLVSGQ